MNYNGLDEFCDSSFWNSSLLLDNWWPQFTTCFMNTILVWVPCGYVWLLLPYFLYDVNNKFSTNNLHPLKLPTGWENGARPSDKKEGNITVNGESDRFEESPRGKFTILCIIKIVLMCILALLSLIRLLFDSKDQQPLAVIVSSAVYLVTYLLVGFELWFERRKCRIAMFTPFYFYFMNILTSVIPLYTWFITENNASYTYNAIFLIAKLSINFVCFVLTFQQDNPMEDRKEYQQMDTKISPEILASYPSRLLFIWFLPLIRTAVRKEITSDDVFNLNPQDQGRILNPMFARYWEEEVDRVSRINASRSSQTKVSSENKGIIKNGIDTMKNEANDCHTPIENGSDHKQDKMDNEKTFLFKKKRYNFFGSWNIRPKYRKDIPSLFRVLWRLEGKLFRNSMVRKILSDFVVFSGPMALGVLVDNLQNSSEKTIWQAYVLCLLLLAVVIGRTLLFVHSRYGCVLLAVHIRTMLASAIYKKAMSMSNSARNSYPVGQIVNLLSVDCQRIQECLVDIGFILSGPVQIVIAIIFLYVTIGPAMLAGVGVLVLTVPFNSWLLGQLKITQEAMLILKDKRSKIISEVLQGMKVLKLYAWENEFKKKVETIRSGEIKELYKIGVLYGLSDTITWMTPFLCTAVTFITYILIDNNNVLDAKTAFVSLALFNLLRVAVLSLRLLMAYITQIFVSIKRINMILVAEDLDFLNKQLTPDAVHAISVTDGTFAWDSTLPPTLWNVNANIAWGQLTAIVGPVGSGKSSLISAILGEMVKIRGQVTIKGTLAFVSQQPWIQNATIRDNILFGKQFNKNRYMQGINMSGGQKQRISLARAVYNDSDIYLFDDPLSAVDAHVGQAIFKNVFSNKGLLANKTRVFVTHGIYWLSQVDNILVLTNGIISEQGSYNQLITHNGPFAKFLQEFSTKQNSDESTSDEDDNELTKSVTKSGMVSKSDKTKKTDGSKKKNNYHTFDISESSDGSSTLPHNEKIFEGKLTIDETLQTGGVSKDVFVTFGKALGITSMLVAMFFYSANKGVIIWTSFFMLDWTKDELLLNISTRITPEGNQRMNYYLIMYGVVSIAALLFTLIMYNVLYWRRMVHAAQHLHQQMIDRLFHAPMSFFDETPTGRIINRVSKDVDIVDSTIPVCTNDGLAMLSFLVIILITVLIQTPVVAPILIPISILFYIIQKYQTRTARQLKRNESITRSPIFTHLSESCIGAAVIRAFRATERFVEEFEEKLDTNQKYFLTNNITYSWLQLIVDSLAGILIFISSVILIAIGGGSSDIGLSVSNTLQLTLLLTYMVKQINEFETSIVAVERIKEYWQIKQEAALTIPEKRPSPSWPSEGSVTFTNYQTRYREGLDLVLKGINCHINGGEKIGVIGRTGAGKSSLTLGLFRIIEAVGGDITIDGINISDIGLHDLREKLTVLPQDPFIFSGSIRANIDPFEQYSDEQLWSALERSHLKTFISGQPDRLGFECGNEGSNLSFGQRQLVCLARAILRHTKILILDEATASVDMETDALIQKSIKESFNDCTVIAIAHRLNTIMDYDRIIVMDNGVISEFDTPQNLIGAKGIFYSLCRDSGLV